MKLLGKHSKKLLPCGLFLLGLIGLIWLYSYVITPTSGTDKTWFDYKDIPRNQLDVLSIGSSRVYTSINPAVLWDEAQIASYTFGTPSMRFREMLTILEEALKTQNPTLLIIDLHELALWQKKVTPVTSKGITLMPWGIPKIQALLDGTTSEKWVTMSSASLAFHSRIVSGELGQRDFQPSKFHRKQNYHFLGYHTRVTTKPFEYSTDSLPFDESVYRKNYYYLKQILDLANDNGIQVLLIEAPTTEPHRLDEYRVKLLNDLSRDYPAVKVLWALDYLDKVNLDLSKDFENEIHPNMRGAEKYSRWLTCYLSAHYAFQRHTGKIVNAYNQESIRYAKHKNRILKTMP